MSSFPYNRAFDLNRDGKLDAKEFAFMMEVLEEEEEEQELEDDFDFNLDDDDDFEV